MDPEEQELRGLVGRNFRAGTSFMAAVDELIAVQKRLQRKLIELTENGVTGCHGVRYGINGVWSISECI